MTEKDERTEAETLDEEQLEEEEGDPILIEDASEDEGDVDLSGVTPPDRRLLTQPYDLAVGDLVNQIEGGHLTLNPVYQRRYVWDNKKASKLVESLLINVPIPVCYLAEEADGSRSTIDGQQRLRSLYRFLKNQFPLRGLEVLPEVNGKRYHELTERQQRLVRNRTIRCIVISEDSDPEIRFNVFERLNTGSVALTAQELRNSVYRGSLNELLHEVARSSEFLECVAHRTDSRMAFEELVLRFLALDDQFDSYRPPLKRFLNEYQRANRMADEEWLDLKRTRIETTLKRVRIVFDGEAFRRAKVNEEDKWEWLPTLNSAVYDVVMLNFARIDTSQKDLKTKAEDVEQSLAMLTLYDTDFADAISRATGDRTRLYSRVRIFARTLKEHGLDSGLDEVAPSED